MAASKTRFGDLAEYQDSGFAVGFLVHLVGIVGWVGYAASSGLYAATGSSAANLLAHRGELVTLLEHRAGRTEEESTTVFIVLAFAGVLFAMIAAAIWMLLLLVCPTQVVKTSVVSLPVLLFALAAVCFAKGSVIAGAITLLIAVLAAVWCWFVWDQIEYTSHLVRTTSATYSKSMGIYGVAIAMVVVQAAWTVLWLVAVVPISHENAGNLVLLWPLFLLSYFWTCQVLANILFVSCCGVMARWYFNTEPESAVGHSFKHACTTSLGSICLGSLIIAVVQTLKYLAQQAQQDAEEDGDAVKQCLSCVAVCILGCMEDIINMVNTFAFIYVAMYGMCFWDAAGEVFTLMEDTDALTSYSLVGVVAFFGTLSGGVFTCAILALLAWNAGLAGSSIALLAFLGFLIGVGILSVVSRMLEGGSLTLFICYTEEPKMLEAVDSELNDLFAERKHIS